MTSRVAPLYRWDAVEYLAVKGRAQQLEIFGMRPHQRHGRAGRIAQFQPPHRRLVPDLLGKHSALGGELLIRRNQRCNIAPRRQFVMRALAQQQRPGTALAVAFEWPAVSLLPIAVMV